MQLAISYGSCYRFLSKTNLEASLRYFTTKILTITCLIIIDQKKHRLYYVGQFFSLPSTMQQCNCNENVLLYNVFHLPTCILIHCHAHILFFFSNGMCQKVSHRNHTSFIHLQICNAHHTNSLVVVKYVVIDETYLSF